MTAKYHKTHKRHALHSFKPTKPGKFARIARADAKLRAAQFDVSPDEADLTASLEGAVAATHEFTEDLKTDPIETAKKQSEMFLKTASSLLGGISGFIQNNSNISPQLKETLSKVFKLIDDAIKSLLDNFSNIFKASATTGHEKSHDKGHVPPNNTGKRI